VSVRSGFLPGVLTDGLATRLAAGPFFSGDRGRSQFCTCAEGNGPIRAKDREILQGIAALNPGYAPAPAPVTARCRA